MEGSFAPKDHFGLSGAKDSLDRIADLAANCCAAHECPLT
ncbi:MAG: hypothetical protein ACJAXK_000498 [Yoonia sp.]|jgi:hypothetical protein